MRYSKHWIFINSLDPGGFCGFQKLVKARTTPDALQAHRQMIPGRGLKFVSCLAAIIN